MKDLRQRFLERVKFDEEMAIDETPDIISADGTGGDNAYLFEEGARWENARRQAIDLAVAVCIEVLEIIAQDLTDTVNSSEVEIEQTAAAKRALAKLKAALSEVGK